MWGDSIIGFGKYTYTRKGKKDTYDWMLVGFSPRKTNISLYLMNGFDAHKEDLQKLGKHRTAVGCLYINKLEDTDIKVLKKIIKRSFIEMKKKHAA